jgi:hypothetical protein
VVIDRSEQPHHDGPMDRANAFFSMHRQGFVRVAACTPQISGETAVRIALVRQRRKGLQRYWSGYLDEPGFRVYRDSADFHPAMENDKIFDRL